MNTAVAAAPSAAGGALQMVLSLAVVLGAIFALAWLLRRMQGVRAGSGANLRVNAGLQVGAKERVLMIQAGDVHLLIGVAPGQVNVLHRYEQAPQIEQWGLMSYHYLSRNLTVALALLPELPGRAPWIQIGGHGLALWLTIALVAVPVLLYQNSGWVQFGYRFSLDYMVFLVVLLAIGGRPISRLLIAACIAINLFGAVTFDRAWKYYRTGGSSYDVVVAN